MLHEKTQAFSQGKDKIIEPLKNALSVLDKLSVTANLGQDIGLVRPWAPIRCSMSLTLILQNFAPVTAIHTGLGVLLSVCAIYVSARIFVTPSVLDSRERHGQLRWTGRFARID